MKEIEGGMGEQGLAPEMDRTRNRDFKPERALIEPVIGYLKVEHRMGVIILYTCRRCRG